MKKIEKILMIMVLTILVVLPTCVFAAVANTPITSIAITIDEPAFGKTPGDLNDTLTLTGEFASNLTFVSIEWWRCETNGAYDNWIEMTNDEEFVEGYYYAFDAYFNPNELYEIAPEITGTINGNNHNNKINEVYYYNGETSSFQAYLSYEWEPLEYSYEFISGDNQKFTKGSIKSYTFTIDADHEKLTTLFIDGVEYELGTDFVVTKGSTVVTFVEEGISKLNKLSIGEKPINVYFNNQRESVGTLIITGEANPDTSDNVTTNFILGSISLISLGMLSIYLTKKKRYN